MSYHSHFQYSHSSKMIFLLLLPLLSLLCSNSIPAVSASSSEVAIPTKEKTKQQTKQDLMQQINDATTGTITINNNNQEQRPQQPTKG